MVGNVQKWDGDKDLSNTGKCVSEFHQYAELARKEFFSWEHHIRCCSAIEEACRARDERIEEVRRSKDGLIPSMASLRWKKENLMNRQMSVYKMSIDQAKKREAKLRSELTKSSEWSKGFVFHKVPGMSLKDNGDLRVGEALGSCKNLCLSRPLCKSISYRKMDGSCYYSSSTMAY